MVIFPSPLQAGKQDQPLFPADERYYLTPYIGQHGWVSLKVHAAPLDWVEIGGLVEGSYRMFAPKNLLEKMLAAGAINHGA